MFIYLFARFLFNPKLLLTDLRSDYGGYLSAISAFLAIATVTMSNCLVFNYSFGPVDWFLNSIRNLLLIAAFAFFYLPVVHFFAEKKMPGSRISDLMAYCGFALSPLFLSLPFAIFFLFVDFTVVLYAVLLCGLTLKVIHNLLSGIKSNYQLTTAQTAEISLSPIFYFILFPILIVVLTIS